MSAQRPITAFVFTSAVFTALCVRTLAPSTADSRQSKAPPKRTLSAKANVSPRIMSLTAEPPAITLYGPRSEGHLVITGRDRAGRVFDLTDSTAIKIDSAQVASVGAAKLITP